MAHNVLVQLSDLHLPGSGLLHGRVDARARLDLALAAIERFERAPDVLVLSGDVADAGEPTAYAGLRELIGGAAARLGAALAVVPGNHDDGALLARELGLDAGSMDTVVERDGLRVVGLDTTVAGAHHGRVEDAQLAWLAERLATPAPAGTVLVMHHPPLWSTTPASELLGLRDPERLAAVLRGSDVRLLLAGHTHRVSAGTFAGVPVWVSPSTSGYADVLAQDGFRGLTGGGITRVDVRDGDVVATYVPLDEHSEVVTEIPLSVAAGAA